MSEPATIEAHELRAMIGVGYFFDKPHADIEDILARAARKIELLTPPGPLPEGVTINQWRAALGMLPLRPEQGDKPFVAPTTPPSETP